MRRLATHCRGRDIDAFEQIPYQITVPKLQSANVMHFQYLSLIQLGKRMFDVPYGLRSKYLKMKRSLIKGRYLVTCFLGTKDINRDILCSSSFCIK